ncbi:hypothetical protein [Alysiella filiformis]|uniref:HNH endonuclease n=1 Tax=Alysiella filiformis DSM 16848 TaxID=1120981 RepID=A0A286EED5_9NEIS|nr:hypothetical protein [Alysiella filiformis]QMT31619.1 hypothetical protein H3L97_01520 [Alysiella filiformis]UBQ55370.1 hypothetical protein JF568_07155 [Alysiella filiformis DSM 16848]SOD69267.1 hypothetical protein SAMN02746062_01594 [Alysiella filiformis DSM 16848]
MGEYTVIVLSNKRKAAHQNSNGICILCNKPILSHEKWSVEHFIPRAIYKWIPKPEIEWQVESDANLFAVHMDCNLNKNAEIPTVRTINALRVAPSVKEKLLLVYWAIYDDIEAYRSMKQSVWAKQNGACAFCEKAIRLTKATLRRIDNRFERSRENAMCLCFHCSLRAARPAHKQKMVNRKRLLSK